MHVDHKIPKKAVILLSGGLDSSTCLAVAKSKNFSCYALSMDYGQKNSAELHAAKKIAEYFSVAEHKILTLPIGELGGSALTDKKIAVKDYEENSGMPNTYVPARNTIFLSMALGWAEILHADTIFIGVNAVDYSGYPDCRPDYISAFEKMANLATKAALDGKKIHIETPLVHLSKSDIIALGTKLGVDYSMTVSCYRATQDGLACGHCDSCMFRKKGFAEARVADHTKYILSP